MTVTAAWSGEYGSRSRYNEASQYASLKASFFIAPGADGFKGQFEVGEKEPLLFVIYPVKIEKVTKTYYTGLMRALSKSNTDVSIIEKYLDDGLVKQWHHRLRKRKNEIAGDKDVGWWESIFR